MLVIILYTLLYIEKEQKQTEREGQRLDGLPSFPPRPRPLPLLQVVREGKSKAADETGRKRTRAKDAAAIFARPLPLFCSVCCLTPSAPSPAAHPSPRRTSNQGREEGRPPRRGLGDVIATPCHHLATDRQRPAATGQRLGLSVILPASAPSSSLCQVVRGWRRASQGGRSPPAHPVDPLHPAGECLGILADTSGEGRRYARHTSAGDAIP